jgi:hypothetical protein
VVGGDDLVAVAEAERAQHDRGARGGVRNDGAAGRVETDERRQMPADGGDAVLQRAVGVEADGVGLDLVTQPLLRPLDGSGTAPNEP